MKRPAEILMIVLLIFAGVIFFAAAVSVFTGRSPRDLGLSAYGEKIGVVEVKGVILDSEPTVRLIADYRDDKSIKAVLVRIDSPGGGVAASQEIYEALKKTRDQGKIVVASMGSVAASGGYYVACGADTIIANPGTTTGSIGVIMDLLDYSEFLKKIGLRFETIKSGKFKDAGSGSRHMTEDERAYFQKYINDAFGQFVDVVATERKMERASVLHVADGRVFTGQQALAAGLVDVMGTYEDAVSLTAEMAGISGTPHLVHVIKRRRTIFDLIFGDVNELVQMVQNMPVLRYQFVY